MLPMIQTDPVLFNCVGHSLNVADTPAATLPPSLTPESDVDDLAEIFFDVDVSINTYPSIAPYDYQLGDTWRGMQDKMSVIAPAKKIRKKSDNKPQSQINKCHNEKRRRELENETINQLEELLGTCLAEVKQPDKNGIVREATGQIQQVLRRRRECPSDCPLRTTQCLSPVQGGEVTSTQPQIPQGFRYSEVACLIETLKEYTTSLNWILLEINADGEIECITENIKDLIHQDRRDLHKKSIFSLLHTSDHQKFKPLLKSVQNINWNSTKIEKFQAIDARLIVQNTNGTEDARLVEVLIYGAPVPGPSSEQATSVMCVIRRCDDPSTALFPVDGGPPATNQTEHIVFRLDPNLTILTCYLGVKNCPNYKQSFVGVRFLNLVEKSDRARVESHLREAKCAPASLAVSSPFFFRLSSDKPWVKLVARSRLFKGEPTSGESDFIMSSLSPPTVLDDDENIGMEESNIRRSVGGPMLPSATNGESSSCEPRYGSSISPVERTFMDDFEFESWTSTFQLSELPEETKERKENATEGPRMPQTSGNLHEPTTLPIGEESTRLRTLLSNKPSPSEANTNNRILKDLLKQEDEEGNCSESSAPHTPLTPLTPHTPASALSPLHSAASHGRPSPHTPHTPLTQHPPHTSLPSHQSSAQHSMQKSHHGSSDMLLKILNEKSDEDCDDSRRSSTDSSRASSQPGTLLSQLLSTNNTNPSSVRSHEGDNYFERLANKRKFDDTKIPANVKRAALDPVVTSGTSTTSSNTPPSTNQTPTTSSSISSKLCEKNQILVSLLEKENSPAPIPLVPPVLPGVHNPPEVVAQQHNALLRQQHTTLTSILNSQSRVSVGNVNGGGVCAVSSASGRVVTSNASVGSSPSGNTENAPNVTVGSHLAAMLRGARPSYQPMVQIPSPASHYLYPPGQLHMYRQPGGISRGQGSTGDSEVPNDQMLSELLDEFIEQMPDDRAPDLDLESGRQPRNDFTKDKNENARIDAIRQSLMQFETVPVSSPGPPPPVYPVQSPTVAVSAAGHVMGGAMYNTHGSDTARARHIAEQQRARLLQQQRSQQMLVPPEAAEQPQSDLGSTISALNVATPPNVALTRTDYHHIYHPSNQITPSYGSNKITSPQQNPMLSRQLSLQTTVGSTVSSPYTSSPQHPASLHTPLTPQPQQHHYNRPPRPHLVGGYYEVAASAGGGGYCGAYTRRPHHMQTHAPHHGHHPHHTHPHDQQLPCGGGSNSGVVNVSVAGGSGVMSAGTGSGVGTSSEYVRNELRAVVGARSNRSDLHTSAMHQSDLDQLIAFEMPTSGGGSVAGDRGSSCPAPQSWDSPQNTRNITEVVSVAVVSAGAGAGGDEAREAGEAAAAGSSASSGVGVTAEQPRQPIDEPPLTETSYPLLQKLLSQ